MMHTDGVPLEESGLPLTSEPWLRTERAMQPTAQAQAYLPEIQPLTLGDFPEVKQRLSWRRVISILPIAFIPHSILLGIFSSAFLIAPFGLIGAALAIFTYHSHKMAEIERTLVHMPKQGKENGKDYIIARQDYKIGADELRRLAEDNILSRGLYVRRTGTTAAYQCQNWQRYSPLAFLEFDVLAEGSGSHLDMLAIGGGIAHAEGLLSRLSQIEQNG